MPLLDKALQADIVFHKSTQEALGYIHLAQMMEEMGKDNSVMKQRAIDALERFSNNLDLVDNFISWEK